MTFGVNPGKHFSETSHVSILFCYELFTVISELVNFRSLLSS